MALLDCAMPIPKHVAEKLKPDIMRVTQKQLDDAHLHYIGVVREIFEEIDRRALRREETHRHVLLGWPSTLGGWIESEWYKAFKSRFLEGNDANT